MIPALQQLNSALHRVLSSPMRHAETWFDSRGIAVAKDQVLREHGGASIAVDRRTIMASVEDFRRNGKASSFRELKYVCLGIGSMDDHGWCILTDQRLRRTAMGLAEGQDSTHRKLRCFQALLSAYLSFRLSQADDKSETGWRELRSWLQWQRVLLLDKIDYRPQWFDALDRHAELLTDRPCDKFGTDLLREEYASLNDALSGLSIDADSWVMEETVLAQMRAAAALDDQSFKEKIPALLPITMGQTEVRIGDRLRIKCVALLVSRYSRAAFTPEHPKLQDACIQVIGNPWLRKAKWDAHVVLADGNPDQRAREMVFGWLKGRLIHDFFELLSSEGSGDRRRLAYWLRFAPFVDDMWFALGSNAQSRTDTSFRELRDRAKGRLLNLEATTSDNNAFLMRIGAYLAVEFGAKGNAFYLLEWSKLPKAVAAALTSERARESIEITTLKPRVHVLKRSHMDAPTALKSWEQKFDDDLIPRLGVMPKGRPACVPDLERLLEDRDVAVADTRARGGSLKLTPDERLAPIARQLTALGMLHRPSRGWFKE